MQGEAEIFPSLVAGIQKHAMIVCVLHMRDLKLNILDSCQVEVNKGSVYSRLILVDKFTQMRNTMHLRDEFESFPRRNNARQKGLVTNSNNITALALTEEALRAAGYNGGLGDVAMTAKDALQSMQSCPTSCRFANIFVGHWSQQSLLTIRNIDLLAILQKSLDRAIFLYNFTREVRLIGV